MLWKMRHSIYWLSKSSDDLKSWRSQNDLTLSYHSMPASDKAWRTIAKIFLDALKAAWLLGDLGDLRSYKELSFKIQEVVVCTNRRALIHLQSFYTDIFTVPNYDLIYELGDFGIYTDEERERRPSKLSDSHSITPAPVLESKRMRGDSTNTALLVELEASSPVSLTDSHSHSITSALRATPSTRRESNRPRSDAEGVTITNIPTLGDGLHIKHLEDLSVNHEGLNHISARLYENELSNAETASPHAEWTGFRHNVFSIESNPPNNTAFVPTCVRIFKLESHVSSYLHLITHREALPTSRSVIQPSTTALVPVYAFTADRSRSSELYISDSGMLSSLRYKFHCEDANGNHYPWELYGFQGALMGAHFEGDYSAAHVSLHRYGSQTTESERFPRIQVWTDFPSARRSISDPFSHASLSKASASSSLLSSISRKNFSALTSYLTNDVNDSKIFIFSGNFIYVFFGQFADSFHLSKQIQNLVTYAADPLL